MLQSTSYGIGLMSGTSLDGVDIVYIEFTNNSDYFFKIIFSETVSYSNIWIGKLKDAFISDDSYLSELDYEYGVYLGKLIHSFINKNAIGRVDFIASHGHTVFHKPDEGYTLQVGNGQVISDITGVKVVCDFRTQDVLLKGQGAPLVPIGDRLLFGTYDYCLNLGGFANISFEKDNERIAYDICPVNIVLNHYVNSLGFDYDDKGKVASKGKIDYVLLEQLNELSFYKKNFPKSLGLEWVEAFIFPLIDKSPMNPSDILRTFVEHIAIQITNNLNGNNKTILVTGGGTFNDFLISRIKAFTNVEIVIPSKEIIEYKEALIFALLGLLKLQNSINVLSSVTGAKKSHSSGKIFTPITSK